MSRRHRMVAVLAAAMTALMLSGCSSAVSAPSVSASSTTTVSAAVRASPTTQPTDPVELGVIASRDSPIATVDFLAQNHWSGYVDGTYMSVFAGIDRHHSDGRAPDAALAVFRYPGAVEVGLFHSGTGSKPLEVTGAVGDLLTLSDGHPHPIQFTVNTHRFTPASYPTSNGCSPNGQSMPAGVRQAQIADIDHDGRSDTEWAELIPGTADMRFGITTASGATFTSDASFAGGAARSFVAGTLANGVTVLMPSEGRATDLWTVTGCVLHQLRSTVPTYSGDFGISITNNETGGGSATCTGGRLAAVSWTPDGSTTDTITGRYITISSAGTTGTLTDSTTVIARHIDLSTTANTRRYTGISCASSSVLTLNLIGALAINLVTRTSRRVFRSPSPASRFASWARAAAYPVSSLQQPEGFPSNCGTHQMNLRSAPRAASAARVAATSASCTSDHYSPLLEDADG